MAYVNGERSTPMYKRTRQLLTEEQRKEFTQISASIDEWELGARYTLEEDDLELIKLRRRESNRLGFAVQLCVLRNIGWTMVETGEIPNRVIEYIANQLQVDPDVFQQYAKREPTRREHMIEIRKTYGYRLFSPLIYRSASKALFPHALETHHAISLIRMAIDWLRKNKVLLPAMSTIERLVWETRRRAEEDTFRSLNAPLTSDQKKQLDDLIETHQENGKTLLGWIKEDTGSASPNACNKTLQQLLRIRDIGLQLKIEGIHPQRIRDLARLGRNYDPHAFRRFSEKKRYAILVAYLIDLSQEITDQVIEISRRQIANLHSHGKKTQDDIQKQNGKSLNEKLVRFVDLTTVLIEAREQGIDIKKAVESYISWDELIRERNEAQELTRPDNYDFLDLLKHKFSYLRRYTPFFLKEMKFESTQAASPILEAIEVINGLNESKKRKVPEDAPLDFLSDRWLSFVVGENGKINKTYYEMATLTELHNYIRSGDVSVSGSKQHKDFDDYLVSKEDWELNKIEGTRLAVPHSAEDYLEERTQTLRLKFESFSEQFSQLEDVKLENGSLHVARLEKQTPTESEFLSEKLYSMIPRVKLTDLLMEVATWTGFDEEFTHASTGYAPKRNEKVIIMAALMGMGTNIGLTKMAEATPDVSYRQMANASQWRMYEDALNRAQAVLVNFQKRGPFAYYWGDGTTSSSDGMRVQVGVSSLQAESNPHYGHGKGATFYRFVSDQNTAYYNAVINTNSRDALQIIDGIYHHMTDLDIQEHYTDTAGYTDHVFGLSHALSFRFAPRLRDLDSARLFTIEKASEFPELEEHLKSKVSINKIRENYDDVLRVLHSVREGVVSGSLIMGKLNSYNRKNKIAEALTEMGKIEKTIFLLDYASDKSFRHRIQKGLNKGESMNSLARAIFFGKRGILRERALNDQLQRASSLSLIINAVSIWNTVYLEKASQLLMKTDPFPEHLLQHVSSLGWNHINFLGEYTFNTDQIPSIKELRPLIIS